MPLLIEIKTGDKLILNGAVIENAGPNCKILLHNKATVLRGKEVLSAEDAQTPASRTYYALQCAYIFPEQEEKHLAEFQAYLSDYLKACPSASDIGEKIRKELDAGRIYKALKHSQDLIQHEHKLVSTMLEQTREMESALPDDDGDAASDTPPST